MVLLGLLFVVSCGEKVAPVVDVPEPVAEVVPEPVVEEVVEVAPMVKEFTINGKNYEFDVKEMRVSEGDTVRVEFTSSSGFHDWTVDEFNAATDQVSTGKSTSIEFVANKAGTYEYYCSVGSHRLRGMVGTLIVE